jgi:hypothetical protein
LAAVAAAAASLLTDDLIVEILSRLPVRSVHRFKCVSKLWHDLIVQPAHRKLLPQTLAGFLYTTFRHADFHHHFAGLPATVVDFVDPSLPFLRPMKYSAIDLLDTCNGLLLCACYYYNTEEELESFRFVVCNPATQRWTELPPLPQPWPSTISCIPRLAFDPAAHLSHFHVFDFEATGGGSGHLTVTEVNIYSSSTGAWTHRDIGLVDKIFLDLRAGGVFVGGMLHLLGTLCPDLKANYRVLVVGDMEGKTWKTISLPYSLNCGAIGLSQGCLHYATESPSPLTACSDGDNNSDDENTPLLPNEITVWFLKNYDSQEWVLKHNVGIDKLLNILEVKYEVAGFHPDCDTVFFVTTGVYGGDAYKDASLASWDMRRREFCHILELEKNRLLPYLPYVPLFSESTLADADGH